MDSDSWATLVAYRKNLFSHDELYALQATAWRPIKTVRPLDIYL